MLPQDNYLKTREGSETPAIPEISPIIMPPPAVEDEKLITLSVTEDVPLRDVFVEIARKADMDLEIDPGVKGGIIFRAKDKPFTEVVTRICDLADLRCIIRNHVLKVSLDTPYIVNYPVDFLNLVRSNKGEINITSKVLSSSVTGGTGASTGASGVSGTPGGGSSSNDNFSTGSKDALQSSYEGDLWKAVEEGVKAIMANYNGKSTGISGGATAASVTPGAPIAVPGKAATPNSPMDNNFLTLNKQAGVITVLAPEKKQREIKRYLDSVQMAESAQVLIEAKVVEVDLSDEYSSGIKWDVVGKNLSGTFNSATNAVNPFVGTQAITGTLTPLHIFGTDTTLDSAVSFTQQFGTTRTLSSPRINAMNNQQAVMTFAENAVFFQISFQQTQTVSAAAPQTLSGISSSVQTVPIGVIMTLQPSINLDTQEITMNIRPTISSLLGTVPDPAVPIAIAQLPSASQTLLKGTQNLIPQIQVRELDSILKIKSGDVMVIGGLMSEKHIDVDNGVPGLMKLPYIGNLFRSTSHNVQNQETVIFIKATIIPASGKVSDPDKDFYETFQTKRS